MSNAQPCADIVISNFVKKLGKPYWPNWAGLIPGDSVNGWGASKADWRIQADGMMDNFELCCGEQIQRSQSDIDKLRSATLSVFSDYLVEKASVSSALRDLAVAKRNLSSLKLSITTFRF